MVVRPQDFYRKNTLFDRAILPLFGAIGAWRASQAPAPALQDSLNNNCPRPSELNAGLS
jgi:hypothetical protein